MRKGNTIEAFFALLRAGLWGEADANLNLNAKDNHFEGVEWEKIYQLAQEQSVQGLVLAGLEHSDIKPPKELLLQWIGEVQVIEQRNKEMNVFVADLIEKLRKEDIYAILVKGQGVAQCYEKPLWRSSGDIDLFLSDSNYDKARSILQNMATTIEEEDMFCKHLAMAIDGWDVELHGTLRTQLGRRIDGVIDQVQGETFRENKVRLWNNEKTEVHLPSPDNDIIFVFTHILKHFFKEGIGLRQLCDLYRLVWTFKNNINEELLYKRLKKMRMLTEWHVFLMVGVRYLGLPADACPLYCNSSSYRNKSQKLLSYVMESGNFGNNRDNSYYRYPFIIYKSISLYYHIIDTTKQIRIFPVDSIKMLFQNIVNGICSATGELKTKYSL